MLWGGGRDTEALSLQGLYLILFQQDGRMAHLTRET